MDTPVVASNTPAGTGTTCPSTAPSHTEDDILICQFGWKGNQAPQVLTGWNLWFSQATGNAGNGCGQGLWWRRVNPSETVAAPTLTIGATAVERKCHMVRIRGADIDNPANTFWLKQQSVGNNATPTPAGVTLLAPGYQLLHFVTCRGNSSITQPTDYTELADAAEGTTLCVEVSFKDQATAGTISGQAASISSDRWVSAIVAIPSPNYPYFRSQTSQSTTGTQITGTAPTGLTNDDFYDRADGILMIAKAAGNVTVTAQDTAQFTKLTEFSRILGSDADTCEVFYGKAGATNNLQVNRSTSGLIVLQVIAMRNVHQTDFIGNAHSRNNAGTPAPWDSQGRQNTKSTVLAIICADAETNNVNTAPSGYTEVSDGLGIGAAYQIFEDGGSTPSDNWTTTNAANVAGLIEILSHAGVVAQLQAPRSMHQFSIRRR